MRIQIMLLSLLSLPGVAMESEKTWTAHFFDTVMKKVGSSDLLSWYDRSWIQQKIAAVIGDTLELGDEDASQEFEKRAIDAQQALLIPQDHRIKIKKMSNVSVLKKSVAGITLSNGIYLNEEKLNECPNGALRCALLHEAAHVKYHDLATFELTALSTAGLSGFLANSLISLVTEDLKIKIIGSVLVVGFVTIRAAIQFNKYIERRADIEAYVASKCYVCVQDSVERRRVLFDKQKNVLRDNGYLWPNEINKIAEQLRSRNETCDLHKK